jgi:streptomycin 6-kinase
VEPLTRPDVGDAGEWLARWHLALDGAAFRTPTSTLAPARTHDGTAVMIKVSHHEEERRGAALLDAWQGRGAARVLAHDGDAILLERATGGRFLVSMAQTGDDAEAVGIVCGVAETLHAASADVLDAAAPPELVPLRTWFRELFAYADELSPLHRRGADLAASLLDDERDVVALHGDLHHGNVLDFGARGWLAIDPKGLLGERAFDYANLCCNPTPAFALEPGRLESRIEIVSDAAGLDPRRFTRWLVAWCALSSTWHARSGDDAAAASVARIGERALAHG